MKKDRVADVVSSHVQWVMKCQPAWSEHFDLYNDDFWRLSGSPEVWPVVGDGGVREDAPDGNRDIHPTQTNFGRGWVNSRMSSLYYNGIHAQVEPDEIPGPGDTEENVANRSLAVQTYLSRWLSSQRLESTMERALSMGLIYKGGVGLRMSLVDKDDRVPDQSAVDLMRVEALPPHEAVWDRDCPREDGLRYIGHLRQEPIERVEAIRPLSEDEKQWVGPPADVVQDGYLVAAKPMADENYLWVLTLDWLIDTETVRSKGEEVRLAGRREEYILPGVPAEKPVLLRAGVMPYSDHAGAPLSEIVPLVVEPVPHKPWDAIAPFRTPYEENAELNRAKSVLAGQFRRDAARVMLTTDDDEESADKIRNARDWEFVKVPPPQEGAGRLADRYHVLEMNQVSGTLREYVDMIRDGIERSETMSEFSRGKAGQYMRAETAKSLVEYDQATIGRIRQKSDAALARLCELHLRVLAAAMRETGEDSIPVTIEVPDETGEKSTRTYRLKRSDLLRRWKITIIDSTSAPGVKAERVASFQGALPVLSELVLNAHPPDPETGAPHPVFAAFSVRAYEYLRTHLDLPPTFKMSSLIASAPEPEEPPPPPEPAPVQGDQLPVEAMPPPEVAGSPVLESPGAQAILAQAEEEL